MQFVLHRSKKLLCNRCVFIIIGGKRINVGYFLIETPFTCPDFPDSFKEFLEIIPAENGPPLLEALIIQYKTLDYELFKRLCGPYTELESPGRSLPCSRLQ